MKVTKINAEGADLICRFEGFSSTPYRCSANVPTIGYGSTRYPNGKKVTMQDESITHAQALEYFMHDVKQFELAVDAYCVDTINQNQFNALVSFAYNLGASSLKNSTLLKKVNANPNDKSIRQEFMKWVMASGVRVQGLVNRRKIEADLYFKV
jgi:lysozyme